MQRDEDLLLDGWCRYHGHLFGYENLYIIDNGSTKKSVIQDLERFRRLGCNVITSHNSVGDYGNKGEVLGSIFKDLQSSKNYDFLLPLDCDEFISVLKENTVSFKKEDIYHEFRKFLACPHTIKICDQFLNSPNYTDYFYRQNSHKSAFAGSSFLSTDHGHHKVGTRTGEWAISSIAYLHFHNKPFVRILEDAKRKIRGHGTDPSDLNNIVNMKHSMHLISYFTMNELEFHDRFLKKCHVHVPGFTQHLMDLGTSSALLTAMSPDTPPITFPNDFDAKAYLAANPDVAKAATNGLQKSVVFGTKHYMICGAVEGRDCPRTTINFN